MKLLIKLFIIFIFLFALGSGIIYFFILPPRIIITNPPDQAQSIVLDSPLIIKFDKPVRRQKLEHFISPEAYGEWKFEDPLLKNHLYRTLVFEPAIDFKPNTQYQVELKNIINPLGIGLVNNFSFNFKTILSKESLKEKIIQSSSQPKSLAEPKLTLIDISVDWQDHPLSCEAASLKMALAQKGIYVSEDEIMKKIGYDLTPRQDNIWGDPYKTYVGNIDGKICLTGYGVYWEPVAKAANNWRQAEAFSNWDLKSLIKEIKLGNPVIVWGTLPVKTLHDCSWSTSEGKYIKAFQETHVRLAVGFVGEAENPSKIILNDPLAGRLYWSTPYFLTNWETFDYSGVVIR